MFRSILIVLLLLIAPMSLFAQSNVVDEVIWVVGDEPILKSDVEMARLEGQTRGQRWEGDPYCVIPEELAVQKLFLHQAELDSVEVTDAEVFQRVDMQLDMLVQNVGSREKLEEYYGKTMTQIRQQLYKMFRSELLMSKVKSNLVSSVKVTPAQVRRYFKDLPEDSIPFVPTQYEVQIIVREPYIEQTEIDRVKGELRDYTERVNKGEAQFSTLALMYSDDKLTAIRRGETGFMSRGQFVPEFSNVVFNLTDDKTVSKIFETEYGFHIAQLVEKRGDRINVRHILKRPRVSEEELMKCINGLDTISDEIRRELYKFEECVQHISQDKDTRNNYGIMVNTDEGSSRYGSSKFEIQELQTEVARKIVNLNIGEISKPFVMVNKKGKEVVAIVKLKNKIQGHRATMTDDYQILQGVLVEKLQNEKVENWIREMQKTTYVRINEDWRNCEFKYPGWVK
jgi:peptidyl-prolyl cis-trans isomerase SurA